MKVDSWYQMGPEVVMKKLNTSRDGMSSALHDSRLLEFGKNLLPAKKKITLVRLFLRQFLNSLIYVLLAAAVVALVLGEYSDAVFIFLVLLVNAGIGTFQEWKAEEKASALENLIKLRVKVRRNGKVTTVDSEDLVPGDIVLLESGNKVPADIRVIEHNNLMAEEAILTGESKAIEKYSSRIDREKVGVADQTNMLFAGTTITTGRGTGVVVSTGIETEIGKIASSLQELETGKAPLVKRMEIFTRKITYIVLAASGILGLMGYYFGIPVKEIFFFVVAIAVSAIPEGLPIAMTVALSIGASRMAKRNVIIRKLTAVEGLGSCTFIATDKTGTLTVDQQTARMIILPGPAFLKITGEGYNGEGKIFSPEGDEVLPGSSPDLQTLLRAVTICNEGQLDYLNGSWTSSGDPIDVALLGLAYKAGISPGKIQEQIRKVKEVPFESARQFAAVYYQQEGRKEVQIAVKGAIEKIREHIDGERYSALLTEAGKQAASGYRIIAVAGGVTEKILPAGELPQLELLGFVALIDPLRPEAAPAVQECHSAGVQVAMITGDHPATSLAIAKEVGIANVQEQVITGIELNNIEKDPVQLGEILRTKRVFARVTPQQKQLIVEAMRESGHFIAVTGDGVNDAPALKTANIGVAMGYGTDVAKDTASIIIRDNNFASIAAGIEEGRFTYSNLRKIIYLLISTGAAELLTIGLSLAFLLPLPFLPVQLLWLNLVTNGIQDVSLAFEAGEKKVMHHPPRKPDEAIFDKLMIKQTLLSATVISLLAFGLWYHLLNHLHWEEQPARNAVLMLMVLLQNFHTFNCRSETRSVFKIPVKKNLVLLFGVLGAQLIHVIALHVPFMQELLSLNPLPLRHWLNLFLSASLILVVMELFKFFIAKKEYEQQAPSQ